MLDAYDGANQEELDAVTREQIFGFLTNEMGLLARKLKAQGGSGEYRVVHCVAFRIAAVHLKRNCNSCLHGHLFWGGF